jgi:outer membrane receptor for Fe3+-dicitrate
LALTETPIRHGIPAEDRETPRRGDAPERYFDTVTTIGHRHSEGDLPGSAHLVHAEDLGVFLANGLMRVLRAMPGVHSQKEDGLGPYPNLGFRFS